MSTTTIAAPATETVPPAQAPETPAPAVTTPADQPSTARRPLWHHPAKTVAIALEMLALLLVGILTGVVLTLTVLLTNVVKALPPTAVLPGWHGWSTIIVENPRNWQDGPAVPDQPRSGRDIPSPTQPDPSANSQRTTR